MHFTLATQYILLLEERKRRTYFPEEKNTEEIMEQKIFPYN